MSETSPAWLDQAQLIVPAPAKLNLMLHILGRRPDGYHNLQTLFQFLDYGDRLGFRVRADGVIQLHQTLLAIDHEHNIIVRMARAFQKASGCSLGCDLWLEKKLPIGGGLGGGSSNAASTLVALNHVWGTDWSGEALADFATPLGADIPVFVRGQAAFAEGIGERLQPVTLAEPWYVVAMPAASVSTAEIFAAPELTRNSPPITVAAALLGVGQNDCQAVVVQRYPEVGAALLAMQQFATAKMTGTGSCIFGAFTNQILADKVAHQLRGTAPTFVAQGSNISMLHRSLKVLPAYT